MKSKSTLSLLSLAVLFASCTTAYKSGQTPDDVYYSPVRPQDEYVRQEKKADKEYRYQDEEAYRDDRYLRMKIRDHRYTSLYEDYYSYNPYYYHYFNGRLLYNSPWTPVTYWSYYYNPYYSYCPCVCTGGYVDPKQPIYNKPRTFDLSVYTPQPSNGIRGTRSYGTSYSSPGYNPSGNSNATNYNNSGKDAGSFLRDVFGTSGSSSKSSSGNASSSSSSSSSGSSSGSSGSTNAPARKF